MMPSLAAAFVREMAMAHVPVLTQELLDVLALSPDSRVVDCTFGAGGHAAAVGAELGSEGHLVACDHDPIAEDYYLDLRDDLCCPSCFLLGNFADTLGELLEEGLDGWAEQGATHIYMDLGVSSMQIDTPERGFSYNYDAPLDMRMDPLLRITAAEILNTWSEDALAGLFASYGEERYARRIARAVDGRRRITPFVRTAELVEIIKRAIPTPARFGSGNPARRVFQALRIEVNDELNSLRRALPEAYALLEPGGVMAVVSFHSLEDRIVKEFFSGKARGCTCPPDFPVCVCGCKVEGEVLTRKAIVPGSRELEANPRSASAKLRALRKL